MGKPQLMTNRAKLISPREREGGTKKVTRENSRQFSTQDERMRSNSLSSRVSISIIDYSYHHIPIRSISDIQKIVEIVTECNILEISGFLDLCRIFPSRVNSTTPSITMRRERKENWISFFHPVPC